MPRGRRPRAAVAASSSSARVLLSRLHLEGEGFDRASGALEAYRAYDGLCGRSSCGDSMTKPYSPRNPHYPDGSRVFCIYGAHVVPPESTDEHDVLLVEDTEGEARKADVRGAIYSYTFKDGIADDEQFIGLTRLAERGA